MTSANRRHIAWLRARHLRYPQDNANARLNTGEGAPLRPGTAVPHGGGASQRLTQMPSEGLRHAMEAPKEEDDDEEIRRTLIGSAARPQSSGRGTATARRRRTRRRRLVRRRSEQAAAPPQAPQGPAQPPKGRPAGPLHRRRRARPPP
jgi:hypothetical protein